MIKFKDLNKAILVCCNEFRSDKPFMLKFISMEISEYFEGKRKYQELSFESWDILKSLKKGD